MLNLSLFPNVGCMLNASLCNFDYKLSTAGLMFTLLVMAAIILSYFLIKQRTKQPLRHLAILGLGVLLFELFRGDFAVIIFAKMSDFMFLTFLFGSLGVVVALERRISSRYSLVNSMFIGLGTLVYLLARSAITIASVEWRFSQFLAVLALIALTVYVGAHRWKYPEL